MYFDFDCVNGLCPDLFFWFNQFLSLSSSLSCPIRINEAKRARRRYKWFIETFCQHLSYGSMLRYQLFSMAFRR